MIELIGRQPPQAIDVEEAVIGALLLDKEAFIEVVDIITEKSFYKESNQLIFYAMSQLNANSENIDIITVTNQLKKAGVLDRVGDAYGISVLTNKTSSAANIEQHARILKEKEIARNIIRIGEEVISRAYDPSQDVFETSEHLITQAYNVVDLEESVKSETNVDLLRQVKDDIQNAKLSSGITGLETGIADKDKLYGGYQKTHFIVKAGRPAMGKSADALCEAEYMSTVLGKKGIFFSLEMSSREITMRRVALNTEIPLNKLKYGDLNRDDWDKYNKETSKMFNENLRIIDTPGISLNQIRKICKKQKMKQGLDFVFIDYLQLIESPIKNGSREQEISVISRGLKKLAKELDIPLIALAQLSRAVESRGGSKKPILSDLRESGSIEQDADTVQFLYRPEYYGIMEDENGESTAGKGYLIVAKNRHGACKDILMRFVPELTKFKNWGEDTIEQEPYDPNAGMTNNDSFDTKDNSSDIPF